MTDQQTQEFVQEIFKKGILIQVHVSRPSFQYKLREDDLLLGDRKAGFHLGHRKAMPENDPRFTVFTTLEGRARNIVSRHGRPFPMSGAYFATYRAIGIIIPELKRVRADWEVKVGEFLEGYDEMRSRAITTLSDSYREIATARLDGLSGDLLKEKSQEVEEWLDRKIREVGNLCPPKSKIRERFGMVWNLFQITGVEDEMGKTLLDVDDIVEQRNQQLSQMRGWMQGVMKDAHQKLGEAAANASKMLKDHKKLTPRNLKPLFDVFEQFKSLDITGRSDFNRVLEEARTRYLSRDSNGDVDWDLTAASINGASGQFSELLGSIGSLAVDEVAEKAGISTLSNDDLGRFVEY